MATTTKGIAYPDTGSNITPIETIFATMAGSIDTILNGYITTSSYATAAEITAGTVGDKVVSPLKLKEAGVQVGDTGWVNIASSVTASAGFKKDTGFYCWVRKVGDVVFISCAALRKLSTTAVPVSTTGDMGNKTILVGIPSTYRPRYNSPLGSGGSGRNNAYLMTSGGDVYLTAMTPSSKATGNQNIPTNEAFSFGGTYITT